MRPSIETFPARLRELREAAGLTQAALAEKAGAAKDTVARLERGDRSVSLWLAAALADAIGCSLDDFRLPPGSLKKSRKK